MDVSEMFEIVAANYKGTKKDPIPIGYQGEHLTRYVAFNISDFVATLGAGDISISAQRSVDVIPYLCQHIGTYTDSNKTYAIWTLDSTDTGVEGFGYVNITYYPDKDDDVDDDNAKTRTFYTYTGKSLGITGPVPQPYEDLLREIAIVVSHMDEIEAAPEYAENTEAWAVGKRNGVDVPPSDPAYHNNAKYYAEQAQTAAEHLSISISGTSIIMTTT